MTNSKYSNTQVFKSRCRAIVLGFLVIIASFVFWSNTIEQLPLPHIRESIVRGFQNALESLFNYEDSALKASASSVLNDKLHIANEKPESFKPSNIQTSDSPIANDKLQIANENPPTFKPSNLQAINDQITNTAPQPLTTNPQPQPLPLPASPTLHPAADELTQWKLSRAWTIAIPSLGVRAPVLLPSMDNWNSRAWDILEEQMQVGLNHGAVAYPHSSAPGLNGNLIVAGHSSPPNASAEKSAYGNLFAALPDIAIGETITVSSVRYRVTEKFVVKPNMTSILEQQSSESILKLITCFPVGTTKNRMIVVAEKVDEKVGDR